MNLMRLLRFAPTLVILGAMVYAGQAVNDILASRPTLSSENPAAVLAKLGLDALAGKPGTDVLAIRRIRDPFNQSATPAGPAGEKADATSVQEDRLADLVDQAVLNATIIQGGTRLAVINGKLYKQGEALASTSRGAPLLVVDAVKRHEVELTAGPRRFTLSYTDRLSKGKPDGRRAGAPRRGPAAVPDSDPQLAAIQSMLGPQLGTAGSPLADALGIQAPPRAPRTTP